jgi:hypothetical protein
MHIILKRPESKYWVEGKYKIFVNGTNVNEIKVGQTVDFETHTPNIRIQAKQNWYGSKKLNIVVSDGDVFEFSGNKFYNNIGVFIGVPLPILFALYRGVTIEWLSLAFLVLFYGVLAGAFYITVIDRHNWITINHIPREP